MIDIGPLLVDADWLASHPEVVLVDLRWYLDGRSGRDAFVNRHLPGAIFIDLAVALSAAGPATHGRHPLPTPEAFSATLAANGIGAHTQVVAYDDSGGGTAGRFVIMLRSIGRRAALLDGGIKSWAGPFETGPGLPSTPVAAVTPIPWPTSFIATNEGLDTALEQPGVVLVDARAVERFRGEDEPIDRVAGHIPGAVNLPVSDVIDPDTGRYRTPDQLRSRFASRGIDEATSVIASCGSGVSACADLVALELAGFGPGRLFVPSWSGWSADHSRPVAQGAQ